MSPALHLFPSQLNGQHFGSIAADECHRFEGHTGLPVKLKWGRRVRPCDWAFVAAAAAAEASQPQTNPPTLSRGPSLSQLPHSPLPPADPQAHPPTMSRDPSLSQLPHPAEQQQQTHDNLLGSIMCGSMMGPGLLGGGGGPTAPRPPADATSLEQQQASVAAAEAAAQPQTQHPSMPRVPSFSQPPHSPHQQQQQQQQQHDNLLGSIMGGGAGMGQGGQGPLGGGGGPTHPPADAAELEKQQATVVGRCRLTPG